MSQKLAVNRFKLVEDFSKFKKGFIKPYNEKSNEGYFLEVHVQYSENLPRYSSWFAFFFPEIKKVDQVKKLVANLHDKKIYS